MADRTLGKYAMGPPIQVPRATGSPLSVGDMGYWDPATQSDPRADATAGSLGVGKSAAVFPWAGTLAATQALFAAAFIGLCAQRWPITGNVPPVFGGQDGWNLFYPYGVAEFDILPGTVITQFALVGPDQIVGGGGLLPQQVVAVASKSLAIGRVERANAGQGGPTNLNASKVLIRFFSAMMAPLTNA